MTTDRFGAFSGPGALPCELGCDPDLDFSTLTKAQRDALGRIAIGCDLPAPSKRTIAVLVGRGLVVPREQRYSFRDGLPPMTVTRYGVPLCVHLAWCLDCASEPTSGRRG